jgi:hypothetical protein
MNTLMPHFSPPPRPLRTAQLDNLALVPASLLPYKAQWQLIANAMPEGGILICLPRRQGRQRETLARVARLFVGAGHRVTTVSAEQFEGTVR